jgi:hypothetical protein
VQVEPRVGRGKEARQDAIAVFSTASAGATFTGAPRSPRLRHLMRDLANPRTRHGIGGVVNRVRGVRLRPAEGAPASLQGRATGGGDRRFPCGRGGKGVFRKMRIHTVAAGLRQHDGLFRRDAPAGPGRLQPDPRRTFLTEAQCRWSAPGASRHRYPPRDPVDSRTARKVEATSRSGGRIGALSSATARQAPGNNARQVEEEAGCRAYTVGKVSAQDSAILTVAGACDGTTAGFAARQTRGVACNQIREEPNDCRTHREREPATARRQAACVRPTQSGPPPDDRGRAAAVRWIEPGTTAAWAGCRGSGAPGKPEPCPWRAPG